MPGPTDSDDFTYGDTFAADIANQIGDDLFAKGPLAKDSLSTEESELPPSPSPAPAPGVKTEVPAPAPITDPNIVAGQNSQPLSMPKSWKKDMEAHWTKLPPEVQKYATERESQVMRGIQMYKTAAEQWQAVVEPYAPLFQANPDVAPAQVFQGLMKTHLQLLNTSTPAAERVALLRKIAADYGLSLEGGEPTPASNELQSLRQELHQLRTHLSAQERVKAQQGVQQEVAKIEAFAADPKNEYFPDVVNDIYRIVNAGLAPDLASAYDMACWTNPVVRQKVLAKQAQAAAPAPSPRAPNGQFVHLDEGIPPPARNRKGSIEDTIDSVVNKHYVTSH